MRDIQARSDQAAIGVEIDDDDLRAGCLSLVETVEETVAVIVVDLPFEAHNRHRGGIGRPGIPRAAARSVAEQSGVPKRTMKFSSDPGSCLYCMKCLAGMGINSVITARKVRNGPLLAKTAIVLFGASSRRVRLALNCLVHCGLVTIRTAMIARPRRPVRRWNGFRGWNVRGL